MLNFSISLSEGLRRYMAELLPMRRKTHFSFEGQMYEFENTFYQSLKEIIKETIRAEKFLNPKK